VVADRGGVAVGRVDHDRPAVASRPVRLVPRPAFLAGRTELLAEIETRLSPDAGEGPRIVILCGLGGAGKTSLAVEYAHRHLAELSVVWQFAADDPAALEAGFSELAAQLGARDLFDIADPIAQIHGVLAARPDDWLLVFDNAPGPEAIRALLPPRGGGRVLITSQNQHWGFGDVIDVPVLNQDIAAEFLARRTGQAGPGAGAAWDLAGELGGLPLALEQAAAYMRATGRSIAGYLDLFRQRGTDMLARGEPAGYDKCVITTWSLAFEQLQRSNPAAIGLLALLACCAPEVIPVDLLLRPRPELYDSFSPEVARVLVPLLEDRVAADDAITALRRYSLTSPLSAGTVSVHRLVQAVTLTQLPAGQEAAWRQAAGALIEAALPADAGQPTAWPAYAVLLPHAHATQTVTSGGMARVASYLGSIGGYTPFVGRGAEQAELRRMWEAVRQGRGRVVGVVGDSGMGKTALVEWFLRDAHPQRRVWVSGAREEHTLSLGILAQVVSALTGPSGRPPQWAALNPEADPILVGQGLLDDLRDAGELILVLDDAQWADRQSHVALRFVARHMLGCPALIIVIQPDEAGLDDGWRRVFESEHGSLLRLGGLAPDELVRLAAGRGHFGLSPAGAARLHLHTGGNPLYASALLDQVPMRYIVSGQGPLPAPVTLAETVTATLAARSEAVQSLLCAGAILGLNFDVGQARTLAGIADAVPPLDEAAATRLVAPVPGTGGRQFAFSHGLVQQAIYDHMGLARRRDLHRRAAVLLTGAEALRHRVLAADGEADADLAADLDRQAALDASRGERAAAADHLRQALLLTPPGPERSPRLLAVVEAELIAGNAASVSPYAAELAAGGGDPWWDYVAGYQSLLAGDVDQAKLRLTRALDAVTAGGAPPRAPADLRARIAAMLAIIGAVSLSYPEMVEYGQIAVQERSTDLWVSAFAWFARTLGLGLAGRGVPALADLDAEGSWPGLDTLVARGMVELWTDQLEDAHRHLRASVDRAYRGEVLRVGQALAFLGEAEYRRGLLVESVLHTELAVGDAEENQRFWDYALLHGLACYPRAARGDWAEAEAHAHAAAQWAPLVGTRSGLVSAAGTRAVIAQARADSAALLKAAEDMDALFDPLEPGVTVLGPLRAEALADLDRTEEAAAALNLYTERFGPIGRRSAQMGMARVRGRIAAARGEHADALVSYDEALGLARSLGLPLEAGRIEMLTGQCLAASGRYGAAGTRLRSALQQFTDIGAAAYRAQASDVIRRLGLSPDAQPDPLASLSGAEQRVALLVKDGLSNREIAKTLFIQPGTVEFHLTNIYRKLGVSGRLALRRFLNPPQ
jgi:DNA-binding CsgD family transcriptional regulator